MNHLAAAPASDLTLDHLYRSYRSVIFNICFSYTRSSEEANDMVQETFFKAYLGLAGFEGRSQPKTWLIRIAINQCLSRILANNRGRRNLEAYLENMAREQAHHQDEHQISRLGADEVLKSADNTTRKVLLLAYKDGLTHSEIAKTLGVSRVAVTRRISRFKDRNRLTPARQLSTARAAKTPEPVRKMEWVREPAPIF